MKSIEVSSSTHRYKLFAFYQHGQIGNIKIPVPGYLLFMQVFNLNDPENPIAGDFYKTPSGEPIRFKYASEAIAEAKKMIGIE